MQVGNVLIIKSLFLKYIKCYITLFLMKKKQGVEMTLVTHQLTVDFNNILKSFMSPRKRHP